MGIKYLLIVSFVLALSECSSHEKEIKSNIEETETFNDISNQRITSVIEDKFGYIWIGTSRGLNKYNGYDYHQYFNNSYDSLSLCDNNIYALFLDHKNNLWVGTERGISKYDYKNGKFINIPIDGPQKAVFQIQENNKGQLFANMHNSVYAYDEKKKSLSLF